MTRAAVRAGSATGRLDGAQAGGVTCAPNSTWHDTTGTATSGDPARGSAPVGLAPHRPPATPTRNNARHARLTRPGYASAPESGGDPVPGGHPAQRVGSTITLPSARRSATERSAAPTSVSGKVADT